MGYEPDYIAKLLCFNTLQVILAPYWFSSKESGNAPFNDLEFCRVLEGYRAIDGPLVDVLLKTQQRHEDYLIPEMSFLSLAAPKVSNDVKSRIACAMLATPRPEEIPLPRTPTLFKPATPITPSTQLHELAKGERVWLPFILTHTDHAFLSSDPAKWDESPDFLRLKSFVKNFRVTNDCSERACQLVSDYRDRLPKDPKQQSALFSSITQSRRERSDLSRKALSQKQ